MENVDDKFWTNFCNKTHAWISSFLKHCVQWVVVGGEHSSWGEVDLGVPQGTVLGPLLFLAYINDLPNNISSNVRLFADDYYIEKSQTSLITSPSKRT